MACRICRNTSNNAPYQVKEMMYGLREVFDYTQCSNCRCLQIKELPDKISTYYDTDYYSFQGASAKSEIGFFKRALKKIRTEFAVQGKNPMGLGKFLYKRFPSPSLESLSLINPSKNSRILDVGCGSGELLKSLHLSGFRNILGIDPFIAEDIYFDNKELVKKNYLRDIGGEWNVIMYHHVFEHIEEPVKELEMIRALLCDDGYCMLRIPTVDSYAWEHYGVDWVQLDAPRHIFLHSRKSLEYLCNQTGFYINKWVYDSTEFQFIGSEQYRQGIPLTAAASYYRNKAQSIFTNEQVNFFKHEAARLNKENRGDSVIVLLKKSVASKKKAVS